MKQKILVIRFSSIGDIVLTSPVLRCLHNQLPGCEIHYLTKTAYRQLIEYNPYVSKVHLLDDDLAGTIKNLQKEKFDLILDLHHNLRTSRVKLALSCPSFSFDKLNVEKWMMVNLKMNRLGDLHIVDRYLHTASTLGVVNDGKGLDFFLPLDFIPDLNRFGLTSSNYIAFAIGGKFNTKKLPKEKLMSLCKGITQTLVLIGGKEDEAMGDFLADTCGSNVINACGKLSLIESAGLIRSAKKVISHDTGFMHIAAAFKKELVSIWGSTIPQFGMTPYYGDFSVANRIVENKALSCRPCSKLGFPRCPKGHFKCMTEINEGDILSFIS